MLDITASNSIVAVRLKNVISERIEAGISSIESRVYIARTERHVKRKKNNACSGHCIIN